MEKCSGPQCIEHGAKTSKHGHPLIECMAVGSGLPLKWTLTDSPHCIAWYINVADGCGAKIFYQNSCFEAMIIKLVNRASNPIKTSLLLNSAKCMLC